jgi:hypothetical protein
MTLQKEIDKMRKDIRTDDLKMSIGEWMNLYSGKEVDIHPEFQRFSVGLQVKKLGLLNQSYLAFLSRPFSFLNVTMVFGTLLTDFKGYLLYLNLQES